MRCGMNSVAGRLTCLNDVNRMADETGEPFP